MAHRAFRHVASHRRRTIEVLLPNPVGEQVDQPGDVGLRLVDQAGRHLLWRQWLGHSRRETHNLDAEARINGLDLVGEQTGHALDVSQWQAGPDAYGLRATIDAVADQIETTGAQAFLLQDVANLCSE